MTVLKEALVTPRGIVLERPLRLMMSPFAKEGVALQTTQPWVGDPSNLSPKQIARTKALIKAAKAAAGTYGKVYNPATGKMMPAIAAKVRDTIEGKLTPTERVEHRRAAAKASRERKRAKPGYLAYLAKLGGVE
jgi:hypothetical protein